jgi:hypothetical protein
LAGCRECSYEPSGSGAMEIVLSHMETFRCKMPHKSELIGEFLLFNKVGKNVKKEKLLQFMCFQSQELEFFFTLDKSLQHYTLHFSGKTLRQ